MLTKIMAYICFWGLFGVGAITTLYALFHVGYRAYLKIKELFVTKKAAKKVEEPKEKK